MEGMPEKSVRKTLESMKDWVLEYCPGERGELSSLFLHEGKKVFYQYIDFPDVSPAVHTGDLIFYVDSDGVQESDLLLLKDIKTGRQKVGFAMPVKLDKEGNEQQWEKINDDIEFLNDVIVIKYAAGKEEYLHLDDFDIFKIVNCIYKK